MVHERINGNWLQQTYSPIYYVHYTYTRVCDIYGIRFIDIKSTDCSVLNRSLLHQCIQSTIADAFGNFDLKMINIRESLVQ